MVLNSFFFQKITKNRTAAGGKAPRPLIALGGWGIRPPDARQWYVWIAEHFLYSNTSPKVRHFYILNTGLGSPRLNECVVKCQHQATASDIPFYDIFAPQKVSLLKFLMTSLHVICGLGPLQSKILATPMVVPSIGHLATCLGMELRCTQVQWRGDGPRQFDTCFGVIQRV